MRSAACIPKPDRITRPSVYGTPAADVTWTYFRPLYDCDAHGTPRALRPRSEHAHGRARAHTYITSRMFRAPHGRPSPVAAAAAAATAENRFAHTECLRRTGATRASRATAAGCTLLAEADDGQTRECGGRGRGRRTFSLPRHARRHEKHHRVVLTTRKWLSFTTSF